MPTAESQSLALGGLFGLGEAYLLAGDLPAALDRFQAAVRLSVQVGNDVFAVRARLMGR